MIIVFLFHKLVICTLSEAPPWGICMRELAPPWGICVRELAPPFATKLEIKRQMPDKSWGEGGMGVLGIDRATSVQEFTLKTCGHVYYIYEINHSIQIYLFVPYT